MKKIIYILFLLFAFTFVHAQNDIKARIEFEEAEKAFEAEDFEKSLNHLKEAEKLIGRWNPITSFLKIEALHAMTDMGRFADPNMMPLYEEVSKYIAHMNSLSNDDIPMEKYKKVYEIEKVLNVYKLHERQSSEFLKAKELHDSKKCDEAIPLYEKLAEKGNSWAMRNLGLIYEIKKDNNQAKDWYLKAIDNGNAVAVIDLVDIDEENARKWYEQAAQMGNPLGYLVMGWYAENVDNNFQKAMEFYQQAIDLGSISAIGAMGDMYKEGKGVEKDFKKAEEYYLIAVKKNSGEAMYRIGRLYVVGGNGITRNHQTAMEWYLKAADRDNTDAMRNIGWAYHHGLGSFSVDYQKAEQWYLKALDKGGKYAHVNLGQLYSLYDNNQPQKALENYEKAAQAGYIRGMLEAANIYYLGKAGISKDYAKAAKYYETYFSNENRDKDNDRYIDNLINIYNRGGYGMEKDKEKAKYWKSFKTNKI